MTMNERIKQLCKEKGIAVSKLEKDITVAVMGCAVNGPGEAKEADLGIAGGIGEGLLIKHGQIVRKVKEAEFLGALKAELDHWDTSAGA